MSADNGARILAKYERVLKEEIPTLPHLHPHLFRHTIAIHLYEAGMPLPMISEWLGHSQMETTLIYAYADTEIKRKAVEKVTDSANSIFTKETFQYLDDEVILKKLYGLA